MTMRWGIRIRWWIMLLRPEGLYRIMNKLIEGQVDRKNEHFELAYGSPDSDEDFTEVALLSKINDKEFCYQFLSNISEDIQNEVLRDLNFYMIEKGEENAWNYAQYHTTTSSNVYSKVQWNFYPANFFEDKKIAIEIAKPELLKIFPDFHENGLELSLQSARSGWPGTENQSIWTIRYAAKKVGTRAFLSYTGADIQVDVSSHKVIKVKKCKEYEESDRIANQTKSN